MKIAKYILIPVVFLVGLAMGAIISTEITIILLILSGIILIWTLRRKQHGT